MNLKTLSVKCPACCKEVLMTQENTYRPFCSKRCKTLDFGGWASESYKIEGKSLQEEDSTEEDFWSDDQPR